MRQHLTIMFNMISKLRCADHELTNEKQVQDVIHSFPSAWEHLRINITHNEKTIMLHDMSSLRRIAFSLISLMELLDYSLDCSLLHYRLSSNQSHNEGPKHLLGFLSNSKRK